jgi:hypothetical protein
MNIVTSRASSELPADSTGPRQSAARESGAFDQTLRAMEKTLWAGAESGGANRNRSYPTESLRQSFPRNRANATLDAAGNTHASTSAIVQCIKLSTDGLSRFVVDDSLPSGSPDIVGKSAQQDPRGGISEQPVTYPHVVGASLPEQCGTHASSPATTLSAPGRSLAGAATASSNSAGTVPYRSNVVIDAGRVSITLRVDGATPDQLEMLKQKALQQARRHGARDVRLVLNGVDQTSTLLPGPTHAY